MRKPKDLSTDILESQSHEILTVGDKISDFVAKVVGSWRFILIQSTIIIIWIILNVTGILTWDLYPFILLNLTLSFQAAYTAPIIMMSQHRVEIRDRKRAEADYEVNVFAEKQIEIIQSTVQDISDSVKKLEQSNAHIKTLQKDLQEIRALLKTKET